MASDFEQRVRDASQAVTQYVASDERAAVPYDQQFVHVEGQQTMVHLRIATLKLQLAEQGLDVCTEAERRVLDEMAKARIIVNKAGPRMNYLSDERNVCRVELARRGVEGTQYLCGSCRDTGKWSNGIDCPVCDGERARREANPDQAERPELVDIIRDAVSGELESAGLRREAKR